jgi:hypothetical protein
MRIVRFLYVLPAAAALSACALFQPIYQRTAVDDAADCIVTQARVVAPSRTPIEAAAATALRQCDVEIHAAETALLAQTQNDGRTAALKLGELRDNQRELARRMISLERAI